MTPRTRKYFFKKQVDKVMNARIRQFGEIIKYGIYARPSEVTFARKTLSDRGLPAGSRL